VNEIVPQAFGTRVLEDRMCAPRAILLAALAAAPASAKVTVPRWFGDNMVFQVNAEYGARSFLNGRAAPGEHITVTFDGNRRFPAIADANGEWEVQFNGGGRDRQCGRQRAYFRQEREPPSYFPLYLPLDLTQRF
jgi:hypothetical protein